jgi:hypothetical protein
MAALSNEAKDVVQRISALPSEEIKGAVEEVRTANPNLFPVDDGQRTVIWMTLLIGLFVLGITSILGTVYLAVAGKEFAAVIALGTAVVGGVLGLFSKSPVT